MNEVVGNNGKDSSDMIYLSPLVISPYFHSDIIVLMKVSIPTQIMMVKTELNYDLS